MGIKQLILRWQTAGEIHHHSNRYEVDLPLRDAARLAALNAMYPGRGESRLLADLVTASLDEIERALPYIPGERVVSEDEFGDPIYEDIGPTPKFCDLTRRFSRELAAAND